MRTCTLRPMYDGPEDVPLSARLSTGPTSSPSVSQKAGGSLRRFSETRLGLIEGRRISSHSNERKHRSFYLPIFGRADATCRRSRLERIDLSSDTFSCNSYSATRFLLGNCAFWGGGLALCLHLPPALDKDVCASVSPLLFLVVRGGVCLDLPASSPLSEIGT